MMAYEYLRKMNNVYLLDTNMFGFPLFQSSYLVMGNQLAMIDTGVPPSYEYVREEIKSHGFSVQDITHVFITHCEHPDHSGNAGAILKENPKAKVYFSPIGAEYMIHPEIDEAKRKATFSPRMFQRFGSLTPCPADRTVFLKEGDQFDLGAGEKLTVYITPGHQPSGLVIAEEKNKGLFINDLPGSYFPDAEAAWIFTPFFSDVRQMVTSLTRMSKMEFDWLYLGHFGMCDRPAWLMREALAKMKVMLDMAEKCLKEGKPQDIEKLAYEMRLPEAQKIFKTRGNEGLNSYLTTELLPALSRSFREYSTRSV
jgi:glyoxylase-like metal-dependent hydrolase (beta-lactamase superfamily II)